MTFAEFMSNVGESLASTAAALDEFGKSQIAPAMEEAGKAFDKFGKATATTFDDFGKSQLVPAMEEAGKTLDGFGKNAAAAFDEFGKNQLAPTVEEAWKALNGFGQNTEKAFHEFGRNKLGPALEETWKGMNEFGEHQLGPAAKKTGKWIRAHPGQTAILSASIVSVALPGLFSGPLLALLGWGDAGVRAGSVAAAVQSSIGNVAAGSTFATVQSAGMSGYGVTVVHGLTRIGATAFGGGVGFFSGLEKKGECEKVAHVDVAMKDSAVGGGRINDGANKVENGSNEE